MRLVPVILGLVLAAPTAFADDADDKARAAFVNGFGDACPDMIDPSGGVIQPPERFDLSLPGVDDSPPAKLTLWQFNCGMGAYNGQSVWFAQDEWALSPLAFAEPDLLVTYKIADDSNSGLKDMHIVGWKASNVVNNAVFDPATLTMRAGGLWRGMGDASDSGVWTLVEGRFRLIHYEADASYDGEINPVVLLDFAP